MPADPGQIENWLAEQWAVHLAASIEAMAGARPAVSSVPSASAPDPGQMEQVWRQPLPPLTGSVWVVSTPGTAEAAGTHVLRALGVEDASPQDQKSTFQETLNQALAGLTQALTARLKREVNQYGGEEARTAAFPAARWNTVTVELGERTLEFLFGAETALAESIRAIENQPVATEAPTPQPVPATRSPADNSKTFALLLEVELPVSVSFGRAQIPLKDVLKLTTGSIVELNRAVTEPVEIIVNNCVIARGEVVVVEGNFGVRIQEVINRQERLRTLQ